MRARLTHISLTLASGTIPVGQVVERGVDLPEEIFDARVQAGTADLVGDLDDVVAPELEAAIARFVDLTAQMLPVFGELIALALASGPAGAAATLAALRAAPSPSVENFVDDLAKLEERAGALQIQSPTETGGGDEAGGDAASEPGDAVTGGPSPGENSSAGADAGASGSEATPLAGSEAAKGPSSDAAGAPDAAAANASTDAPQPTAGVDGDAAGAQPPAAEPAPPSKPSTAAKSPARKGRGKG